LPRPPPPRPPSVPLRVRRTPCRHPLSPTRALCLGRARLIACDCLGARMFSRGKVLALALVSLGRALGPIGLLSALFLAVALLSGVVSNQARPRGVPEEVA